ncbi:MAG: biosynthetic arginine decarboxylase [Desulfobulbaceae bacterium]|uniref:Arginine decarboxylase n=1 Tax=Candidatus Desulfobia pelagia TaxID=2841692 RepID=A0A8J6TB81_9BACT|nr:biosynthetic arginine decarboxylase [Candidatus Desulfobia pelagia]
MAKNKKWSVDDSANLYGIEKWGAGYFAADPSGDVVTTPLGLDNGARISLHEIATGLEERGMAMPVLLRIENILGSQIKRLHDSFSKVIQEIGYTGEYKGVFPIKVNQQEQVLEAISQFGRKYNHGLEAGSKPELIAAISMLNNRDACLICNGYKDEEFVDLGLYATKMGLKCFFVLEMPGELDLILERAEKIGVLPLLGLRIKLSTKAEGQWADSGGETSVFGLSMSEVIDVIDRLKAENKLDCLQLQHYHIGSQIPNIQDIRAGVLEACRIYEELVKEGAAMGYLDLGGGLAVDYDGSKTNCPSSRNYSVEEYCYDIIETINSHLNKSNIAHPTIITESGRATVAYYSILLFNVLDVTAITPNPIQEQMPKTTYDLLDNLLATYNMVSAKDIQECYNDALFYKSQSQQLFKHGQISIREKAMADDLLKHILIKITKTAKELDYVPEEIEKIEKLIPDIYYGNFSLFQSLPDVWAIGQLFPVMPIHRLNEEPTRNAIIADITCDCDGRISSFPGYPHTRETIHLHKLKNNEEYYLGVFLVGAYQETLGDLHNLFGDTNVVSINVRENGSYEFVREQEGDSVEDVLSYVEYDVKGIKKRMKDFAEDSIRQGYITVKERKTILRSFDEGLRGYTYFEKE